MDTRPAIENSTRPGALSVSFNQDSSCFSVGLDTGFCIFNSNPCQLRVARDLNAGIGRVEMLGKANYIGLVGGGRLPKFALHKVVIWDDAKEKVAVAPLEFRTAVRSMRLSKSRIVVVLQNSVHVYGFSAPPTKQSVYETADNPLGLCCLSSNLLAFPGRTPGQVQLVELSTGNVSIIPAHGSALQALTISPDGKVLATASQTGTLIRVFATSNCAKIAELRRGVDYAVIFSLAISPSSQLLAVTSDKSTLHVFDLPHPTKPPRSPDNQTVGSPVEEGGGQKWGIFSKIPLLPRVFSDIYSFASAHFEMGDEARTDVNGNRIDKGVVGWVSNEVLIVIGAGRDARWEKFVITVGDGGRRHCYRDGWKHYLGAG